MPILGASLFIFVITGGTFLTLVQVTFDLQWYTTIMGSEMDKLFAPIFCLVSGVYFSIRVYQFFTNQKKLNFLSLSKPFFELSNAQESPILASANLKLLNFIGVLFNFASK